MSQKRKQIEDLVQKRAAGSKKFVRLSEGAELMSLGLATFKKLARESKISSKLVNGLEHKNSLKALLKEYLNVNISKTEQLSDWSKEILSDKQIEYAFNDVCYLYDLWIKLKCQLIELKLDGVAEECFSFVPTYKKLMDQEIHNIFVY